MSKSKNSISWEKFARLILRNRILFLILILVNTIFLSTQWKNIRFSYSEANLMPKDHPFNVAYDNFVDVFGEEGNLLIIAVNDSLLFDKKNFFLELKNFSFHQSSASRNVINSPLAFLRAKFREAYNLIFFDVLKYLNLLRPLVVIILHLLLHKFQLVL